jgi:hypothetical protein
VPTPHSSSRPCTNRVRVKTTEAKTSVIHYKYIRFIYCWGL